MSTLRNTLVLLCVIIGILASASDKASAATEAGTSIVNQAILSYRDSVTGETVQLLSNTSRIVVVQLNRFSLSAPQTAELRAGDSVLFVHRLVNTGNVEDSYLLSASNIEGDNGQLDNLVVYRDLNVNGLVDAAEPVVSSAITLDPSGFVDLLVSGRVPMSQPGDTVIQIELTATSIDNALAPQSNLDEIIVTPEPSITLELENTPSCDQEVYEGQTIEYRVLATNISSTLPEENRYLIDGSYKEGVLLSTKIDSSLILDKDAILESASYRTLPVIQLNDTQVDWMRLEHWDGESKITRLGFLLPAHAFELNEQMFLQFSASARLTNDDTLTSVSFTLDQDLDGRVDSASDAVCNKISKPAAALASEIRFVQPRLELQRSIDTPDFSVDGDFVDAPLYRLNRSEESYHLVRDGIYLEMEAEVDSEQLIFDAEGTQFVIVNLSSQSSGKNSGQSTRDSIRVLLREVIPGRGVYRSIRPVWLSSQLRSENAYCPGDNTAVQPGPVSYLEALDVCVLNSEPNDSLIVSFDDISSSSRLIDTAVVDPTSRVFDSITLQGIADATVSVFNGDTVVKDPLTDEPVVLITDSTGQFFLPRLTSAANLHLSVTAPETYLFPSSIAATQFTDYSVSEPSYGREGFANSGNGTFEVNFNSAPPQIDIPLDPENRNSLLQISKQSSVDSLSVGEIVEYTIELTNTGEGPLREAQIIDTPPFGYRYLPGSSTLDGTTINDPNRLSTADTASASDINGLYFEIGLIDPGDRKLLRYSLQATPAALKSHGINTAIGTATTPSGIVVSTSPSRVKVTLTNTGLLSDQAILFGKIYVDSTCDNIHNQGEWPIAGVRLYMQDGTYAITDEDGQYSIYGLHTGENVIKVDLTTVPPGLIFKPLDTGHAVDPDSRFVNLSAGDFHRADFATYCPQNNADLVFEMLKKRNKELRGDWLLDEAVKFNPDSQRQSAPTNHLKRNDGDISNGTLFIDSDDKRTTRNFRTSDGKSNKKDDAQSTTDTSSTQTNDADIMGDPKILAKSITQDQAKRGTWLWPTSDLANDGRFMAVVRSGLDPVLFLNDKPVPATQIGERIVNRRENAQIVAWYGVTLEPGENTLEVRGTDPFGNNRVLASGLFKRSGAAVRIHLRSKSNVLPADGGRSMLPIDLLITDINGFPANGVYFVTLKLSNGSLLEKDLQPEEPGHQIRIENGRGLIHLQSTDSTGQLNIDAFTGGIKSALTVVQVPASRPLIATGLISMGARQGWSDFTNSEDPDLEDGFDLDARAALFLKGKIKNDLNLTLSLDTDKRKSPDLLRDVNPDDHYPIYGDSSIRGYEAQSRSKLYAKLEKDRHSVMWGDYITDPLAESHDLARFQRTLTGFNAVYDNSSSRIQLFAAEQTEAREVEEIRGNGTAMLFELTGAPIVINSEIVELITRDRDGIGEVLTTEVLTRYTDYTLDPITGYLRFSYTIPSVDSELNPIFVRVSYDRERDLAEHVVAGLRWNQKITSQSNFGFSLTRDENPLSSYTIAGLTFRTALSSNTSLKAATAAQDFDDSASTATASKIELEHYWNSRRSSKTLVSWAEADEDFNNPTAGISSGREEWRLEHRQQMSNTLKFVAEASKAKSTIDNIQTTTASLIFDKSFKSWSLSGGGRHVQSQSDFEDIQFSTVLLGVEKSFRFSGSKNGSIGIDYEQALSDSSRFKYGIHSRVQLHEHVDWYGRYEKEQQLLSQPLLSSQDNSSSNTQLTIGLESDVLPATQLYSEYRIRGGFSGDNIETASGIKGRYTIQPGLSVSPALEHINTQENNKSTDAFAMSLGLTDTRNPNRKLTAQAEVRDTDTSTYYGFRATLAQKLDLNWTGLIREVFTRQTPDVDELTSKHRFTLGLARRPKLNNKHHTLFIANWNIDYGPSNGMDRTSYLFSTHHNRQINDRLSINGRVGGKWQTIHYDEGDLATRKMLADFRTTFHWRRRWEFDIRAGWLGTSSSAHAETDSQYSLGAGASWIVRENLRLGLSYNFLGFSESELDRQSYNAIGLRLGLQLKFDEDWFRWLED